ncbi:phospholipase D-like domain-containing protein [Undibacterium cyanobacteriorum]|uniref:Phospholipase D-like domain-containing protein n=1 Tax=Undibacterium cyanobacteriorum TaxID=3073561 RepID=A0ABY9RFW6_9BURK|nr:phospholipase D-like domain-containing protein [Undibacterium sp. 20NA77.5]WMW80121.1 phospholipase D-like domain-containing protein [Undibacterium sp. 20NA77.5]
MKFVANVINNTHLAYLLPSKDDEVDCVLASIAYGANFTNERDDFIGNCVQNRYRLDIWMRYDHTVPVAIPLLRRLLKHHKDNVFCKLIPDVLHSKVIWWKGYGAYIGSANLTDRAWNSNIEAGIFLTEADLQQSGMHIELESYFENLRDIDEAIPLSEDLIAEMEAIEATRKDTYDLGKKLRKTPIWAGPAFIEKKKAAIRSKENFRKEWQSTLTELRKIGEALSNKRPTWINEDTPINWQIDQFLHGYYYNRVGDHHAKPYEDYFKKNFADPQAALTSAITWWNSTNSAPSSEDETFEVNAPTIRRLLSRENILNLSINELAEVCGNTHATKEHITKMTLATLGRPELKTLSQAERIPLYANWLMTQRNARGETVMQLLNYVLYGGKDEDLWERLFTASRDPQYTISHYGLNSMAELVGWARPEIAPPRNGRTSKALRALGYDVKIY